MKRQVIVLPEEEFVDYIGPAGSLSYNRDRKIAHSHDGVTRGGKPIGGLGNAPPEDDRIYGLYRGRWVPIDVEKKIFPTGPGPQDLIAGDTAAGFYGEVPTEMLITGEQLALEIGLSAGFSQYSDEPWLKFAYQGKTLFIAKKPYRNNISWAEINTVDAVYGDRIITIDGHEYRVRLMTGGNADPATGPGGEWDALIYHVVITGPDTQGWYDYDPVDLNLTDASNSPSVTGSRSWMQEHGTYEGYNGPITRGGFIVEGMSAWSPPGGKDHRYAWRPVLELVND